MATTTQVTTATMSSFLKDKSSTIQATPLTDIPKVPFLPPLAPELSYVNRRLSLLNVLSLTLVQLVQFHSVKNK